MLGELLPRLKATLNIDPQDMSRDDGLGMALGAAWGTIEEHTRRSLLLREKTEMQWRGPWRILHLENYPVREILEITVDGAHVEGYTLDAERGMVFAPQGVQGEITQITYKAGYAQEDIPLPLAQACVILAAGLLRAEGHGGRMLAGERMGDYQAQYFAGETSGLVGVAPAVEALLRPYVRPML